MRYLFIKIGQKKSTTTVDREPNAMAGFALVSSAGQEKDKEDNGRLMRLEQSIGNLYRLSIRLLWSLSLAI